MDKFMEFLVRKSSLERPCNYSKYLLFVKMVFSRYLDVDCLLNCVINDLCGELIGLI